MGARGGRGPRTLTLVIVASIILTFIPYPAAGADLAIGNCDATTSSAAYQTYVAGNGCDTDDNTLYVADGTGGGAVGLLYVDIDTAQSVGSVRIIVGCSGSGPGNRPGMNLHYGSTSGGATNLAVDNATFGTSGGSCVSGKWAYDTITFDDPISARWWKLSGNLTGPGWQVYTIELLSGGPTEAEITEYIYNLRAYHPPFLRRYTWEWLVEPEWSGTWALTDSDDTLIAGTFRPDTNHIEQVDISCPVICGEDTYTLTVNDATNDRIAVYEIDGDAEGQLISAIEAPRLTGLTRFCYQATTAQCDATITTVGLTKVTYTFLGTVDYDYNVSAGQLSSVSGAPSMVSVGVSGTHVPGTYTLYIPVANMSVTGAPYAVLLITAATGGRTYTVSPELDFGAGGTVTTIEPPEPGNAPTSCPQFDVVCGLRSLFSIGEAAVMSALTAAYEGLVSRQPFAFLFGTATAAQAQLARAQAAVGNSDDCAGVHFTMPSLPPVQYHAFGADKTATPQYYAYNGTTPTATPFAFSAVRCEDLEPWGGTSWWQGLRTIMGPALVMGYAFQLFRRYEVRPQLGG